MKTASCSSYLLSLIPNTASLSEQWIIVLNINVEQKHLNYRSFPGPLPNQIV